MGTFSVISAIFDFSSLNAERHGVLLVWTIQNKTYINHICALFLLMKSFCWCVHVMVNRVWRMCSGFSGPSPNRDDELRAHEQRRPRSFSCGREHEHERGRLKSLRIFCSIPQSLLLWSWVQDSFKATQAVRLWERVSCGWEVLIDRSDVNCPWRNGVKEQKAYKYTWHVSLIKV